MNNNNNADDLIVSRINRVLSKQLTWEGTMTDLLVLIGRNVGENQATLLPRSPSSLRTIINRTINRLRARGITVKFGRTTDHARTRFVRFTSR